MNRYGYAIGISALALAVSALPLGALAHENVGATAGAQVNAGVGGVGVSASDNVQADENTNTNGESVDATAHDSSGDSADVHEQGNENTGDSSELMDSEELPFDLTVSTAAALSLDDLKQSIKNREEEFNQEEADASTTEDAEAMADANPIRLAVHAFLASKGLLGGAGPQVSEIAKEVNASLATTTSAELKIKSRGFFTRLFFGGDENSAHSISQAVAENQARIQALTALMNQAGISADLKSTLSAQISALQEAQAHLQALADIEAKSWGLFSWRF